MAGERSVQVYNSWNTAVKLVWNCPRQTKTFLLQQVLSSGLSSARVDILGRYVNFFRCLRTSSSLEVRVLANLVCRDVQTTTGRNIRTVRVASGMDPWQTSKRKLKPELASKELVEVLPQDKWRIGYLGCLLRQYHNASSQAMDDKMVEIQTLIDSLVL